MRIILGFLSILILFGCSSKKSDKELFEEAKNDLKQDKVPEAVMAFDELVNDYSDSELAPEALSQMAGLYQNKLIKSLSEKENLEKAIELFKKLHEEYPSSSFAPSGLFMAGFIYANELNNFDEATKCYSKFLKDYPDHELAASAQAELDNMGLTPEEILQKNMANEK